MPGEDGTARHPATRAVVWAASAMLSLGILAAATQDPALRIVSASPTGDLGALEDADQVRIIFSEAMVPLGTVPSGSPPPWIRISPPVPGSFYWSGTKTLIFSPDATAGLPYATRFTVRIDGAVASANGRTLGAPYDLTFTTPTVRLLSARWSRKTDRFDSPVILALQFNQPVAPDEVAAHVRVALTPHDWPPPAMSERARRLLQEKDPQGLRRFDEKVEAVRHVTKRSDRIDVRVADSWDEKQFPRKPGVVVLETIGAPPTDSWLTVAVDDGLPSRDGPEKTAAQSTIVKLDSTFFARGTACSVTCDPSGFNSLHLTEMVPLNAIARALSIVDVTDPDRERALAPSRPVDISDSQVISGPSPRSVGYDAQPAARIWRMHLSADLNARDGQTLGYPWVGFVENGHALPWIRLEGTVWEARGGPRLPLIVRNVSSVTHSLVRVDPSSLMQRLLERERERRAWRPSARRPPVVGETQRLTFTPSLAQAHGLDIRQLLTSQGRGLLWASVEALDLFSGPMPRRSPEYDAWALHASSDVQVTNLGISVKDSSQSTLVFVTQLDTALPVADASVAIVDSDNRTVWRGATDRSGVALAPPLSLRQRNRRDELSFVVTAEKDGDFAYVGSDWADREVLSESGIRHEPTASPALLRGSVFTDRGVYKKSEEIHFKAVLRDDAPGGMQLIAEGNAFDVVVRDVRHREVDRRTITVNQWSSAEWTWRVPSDAGLGAYRIEVGRAGREPDYESTVRGGFLVAAFRRPDFRVDASLEADPPIIGTTLRGAVEARYLFGGALGTRSVHWWSSREPVQRPTEAIRNRYPESRYAVGYMPRWDESPHREPQHTAKQEMLGADGRLAVALLTPGEGNAAYSYSFEANVQDVSGQHIANRASFVMHPSSVYVAMSRPPMFVETKTGATVGVTVINLAGEPVTGIPLTVSLLREEWVSTIQPGHARLEWERRELPAGEWTVQSAAGETSLQIPVRDGGCYVLRAIARDAAGRQTRTDVTFYAIGPGVSSWRIEGNRINLTPERKTWKPGETARILIQSPWERATALLTVEREGIRSHRTFTINSMQDTVDVPITEADIPNVYVSVMLVKGRTSEKGDNDPGRPSYRIGYTELSVDHASKRLRVDVSTDREEYRPRQPVNVSVAVATRDGKPVAGEVTLWAIDYGLLSLTNYSTPDVLKAIYISKPLQVTTQDNRERLIRRRPLASPQGPAPLVGGELDEIITVSAMGMGDAGPVIDFMAPVGQADASRPPADIRTDFRPLVFWLGSATTDADGRATTTATLPDSLTTYRVMAVVGDGSSRFGFGEREIRVSKSLTLLPAFPRFLTKGDRASFGALVTNSGTQPGEAIVTIESLDSNRLQFGNIVKRTILLPAGASEHVRFDAVARASGTARARMLVRLGSNTDAFEMPLVVGEPLRHEVTAAYGDTLGIATEQVTLDSKARPETATLTVDLASTALVGMGESARYLDDYPYECAEQKASRALALLLAADLGGAFKLTDVQPDDYKDRAARALSELYDFQCGYAGFALWPGRCDTQSAYLTAYILHVLKVAETLKYPVDRNVIDGALYYLQRQLQEKPAEVQWWPAWAASQAYALKVLAEFGRSQPKEIDRVAMMAERLPIFALSYLADALAASNNRGSQYQDIVRRLVNALRVEADRAHAEETDEDTLAWLWNTNVSATSVVLEGLSRRNDDPALIPALARWLLAARTNGRWGTTHENAKALEALVSYYRAFESEAPQMNVVVKVGPATLGTAAFQGRSTTAHQLRISIPELLKRTSTASTAMSITKQGTGRLYYTARVERLVPESPEPADRGFHVVRRYERYQKDGSSPPTTTFDAGDLVRVTVTVTLRGEGRYLALTDPLPAGVEPIDALLQTTSRDLAEESTRATGETWMSWWRRGTFDHVEKHDDRVVAFATRLGSGRHEFSYLVRATTAGTFTAAGSRLEAMYAPELGGRGAAATITIK